MRSWVQLLETSSCRNARKSYVHKTQSGRTLLRTLRKRDLRAPGCPREYHKMHLSQLTGLQFLFLGRAAFDTVHFAEAFLSPQEAPLSHR
jgi:hypothetical protein